jgi:hypothetical protein
VTAKPVFRWCEELRNRATSLATIPAWGMEAVTDATQALGKITTEYPYWVAGATAAAAGAAYLAYNHWYDTDSNTIDAEGKEQGKEGGSKESGSKISSIFRYVLHPLERSGRNIAGTLNPSSKGDMTIASTPPTTSSASVRSSDAQAGSLGTV